MVASEHYATVGCNIEGSSGVNIGSPQNDCPDHRSSLLGQRATLKNDRRNAHKFNNYFLPEACVVLSFQLNKVIFMLLLKSFIT